MADHVWYLGEFPTDLTWVAGGSDDNHPVLVERGQAHAWWWNARKWAVDTDAVLVVTGSGAGSYPFSPVAITPDGGNASRELDLTRGDIGHTFGGSTPTGVANLVLLSGMCYSGTDIYPYLTLDLTANSTDITKFGGIQFVSTGAPGEVALSCTIVGIDGGGDTTLTAYANVSDAASCTITGGSVTITATEFWPYAELDGVTPVHDTATNALVGNPKG